MKILKEMFFPRTIRVPDASIRLWLRKKLMRKWIKKKKPGEKSQQPFQKPYTNGYTYFAMIKEKPKATYSKSRTQQWKENLGQFEWNALPEIGSSSPLILTQISALIFWKNNIISHKILIATSSHQSISLLKLRKYNGVMYHTGTGTLAYK